VTALPPDPDPASTPAVEHGGGVEPGETPPDSAQTSGTSNADPPVPTAPTGTMSVAFIAIALTALLFLAVAVLLVLHMTGIIP
jgi:hypothetical protein